MVVDSEHRATAWESPKVLEAIFSVFSGGRTMGAATYKLQLQTSGLDSLRLGFNQAMLARNQTQENCKLEVRELLYLLY